MKTKNHQGLVISLWALSILPLYLALLAYLRVFNVIGKGDYTLWANVALVAALTIAALVAGGVSVVSGIGLLRSPERPRFSPGVFVTASVGFMVATAAIGFLVAVITE